MSKSRTTLCVTFEEFERQCEKEAVELEDRLCRYISSVQEHDLIWTKGTHRYIWMTICLGFRVPIKNTS